MRKASIVVPALIYVGLEFSTGVVLGVLRITFVVPAIGVRAAELFELPVMIGAAWLWARWVLRRFNVREAGWAARMGALAFVLMLGVEVGLGVAMRGVGPLDVILDKDPVSGPAYYASVCIFGLMPWLLTRRAARDT